VIQLAYAVARSQAPLGCEPFHQWTVPNGTLWAAFHRHADAYLVRFPDLADFEVAADGCSVTCYPGLLTDEATLQHLYLNQIVPLALSQQGHPVFHGSAIAFGTGAAAFLADSGYGKSTLAASFATNGFPFLTDDGLVLQRSASGFDILPSHPSLRLWSDSQAALLRPDVPTAPVLSFTTKMRFIAGEVIAFENVAKPLRCAYFLGSGVTDQVTIEPMSTSEAVMAWIKHSFLLDVREKPRLRRQFEHVTDLAARPINFRLDFPRNFESLSATKNAILEHTRSVSSP